jgi:hypothetical protein
MNTGLFPPSKRIGLLFHGFLLIALTGISAWGFWRLSAIHAGPSFVLFLVLGLVAFIPIPLLAYRAYALYRAQYRVDRDSLELRWGLRSEVIRLADIEWVRSPQDLTHPLTIPALRLPGAILGLRRHRDLGLVEFLASSARDLLLVATPHKVFAISPEAPGDFLETFSRAVELGSLGEAHSKSLYPSFVFAKAWQSGWVRYLWMATLFLNLGLAVWVTLLIPSSQTIALGLQPDRSPDAVPSVQLVILPLVSSFLSLLGWIAGLFFYRWGKRQAISIVMWSSGVGSSLLFLLSVLFIVLTPA